MSETIITWNATNWLTIILMAGVGFFLLGVAGKIVAQQRAA